MLALLAFSFSVPDPSHVTHYLEDLGLVRAFVSTPRQGAVILTTRCAETSTSSPLPWNWDTRL